MESKQDLYAIGVMIDGDFVHINTLSKSKSKAIEMAQTLRIEAHAVRLVLDEAEDFPVIGGPEGAIGFMTDEYFQPISLASQCDDKIGEIINVLKSQAQVRLAEVHEDGFGDVMVQCGDHGQVPGLRIEVTDQVVWRASTPS